MNDPEFHILQQKFDSIESITKTLNWDFDWIQLDPGKVSIKVFQLEDTHFQLANSSFTQAFHQRGKNRGETYTFALHNKQSAPCTYKGTDFPQNSIFVFPLHHRIDCLSAPKFSPLTVTVTKEKFSQILEEKYPNFQIDEGITICNEDNISDLQQLIQETLSHYRKKHQFKKSVWLAQQDKILELVLDTLHDNKDNKTKIKKSSRLEIVTKVIDYLDNHPTEVPTTKQLCKIVDASERTLQYAFKATIGHTPIQYVKAFRLHQVRKFLLTFDGCKDDLKITDIANQFGFWHIGQFAADYKKLYGELPSALLRRVRRQ